jgi:hypothetical protein
MTTMYNFPPPPTITAVMDDFARMMSAVYCASIKIEIRCSDGSFSVSEINHPAARDYPFGSPLKPE